METKDTIKHLHRAMGDIITSVEKQQFCLKQEEWCTGHWLRILPIQFSVLFPPVDLPLQIPLTKTYALSVIYSIKDL